MTEKATKIVLNWSRVALRKIKKSEKKKSYVTQKVA